MTVKGQVAGQVRGQVEGQVRARHQEGRSEKPEGRSAFTPEGTSEGG